MASTEQGKHKFNTVHFLYNCSISAVLNTNWLYNVYLFLPHLSASVFGHLNGVCCSFVVYSSCQLIWQQFADVVKIIIITEIFGSLKSVLPDFKDLNIVILSFSIVYGKDSSGSLQYRNFLVS